MRMHILFIAAIAMAGAAGLVLAQGPAERFAQLDKNQDGYVALDEVPAELQPKFKRLLKLAGKEQEQKLNRALFEGAVRADKSPDDGGKAASQSAPPAGLPGGDLFDRFDKNQDGVVTAEEAGESQKAVFELLLKNGDIDGDAKLTRDEYLASTKETATQRQPGRAGPAGPGRPGGPMIDSRELFARIDRNQDGKLSKEEAPARIQENFDRLDANGDGSISPEEFARVAAAFGQRPPGAGAPPPGAPPGGGLFAVFDVDRDGELSTSEIVGAGTALLKLDKNGDGKLTPDEVFGPRGVRPPRPPGN